MSAKNSGSQRRSVVVLSGGQDSVTTLMLAAEETYLAGAVHFQYGQRHRVEQQCARWWANHYGVPLEVLPVAALEALGNTALVTNGADLNATHERNADLPASFVPGRNLLFLTLAAAYAYKVGANEVWTGVCQTDYSGYPDCRDHTMAALQKTLKLGLDYEVEIVTPLMYTNKAGTWALAAQHDLLDEVVVNTHTCYKGERLILYAWGYGCGECPACQLRKRGYEEYIESERDKKLVA